MSTQKIEIINTDNGCYKLVVNGETVDQGLEREQAERMAEHLKNKAE